ncbi:MAG: hypothetical protein HZB67_04225 [Candidatus Aenigmarchaeota archaeon]|nr:hypothetical protein [Candidatus Aenigmarchaeota archaeon]
MLLKQNNKLPTNGCPYRSRCTTYTRRCDAEKVYKNCSGPRDTPYDLRNYTKPLENPLGDK